MFSNSLRRRVDFKEKWGARDIYCGLRFTKADYVIFRCRDTVSKFISSVVIQKTSSVQI